jgi:multidrug efflux pump subunit AcrA (membrane-fusion protein)
VAKFDFWGYPITGYIMYVLLRKRLAGLVPLAKGGWQKLKEVYAVWQMTRKQMVGGALAAAVLLAPLPSGLRPPAVSGEFTLEPVQRAEVRAVVPGRVAEIPVTEGERVEGAAVLAVLHSRELEAKLAAAEFERNRAERDMLAARARGDLGEVERREQERQRASAEAAELRRKKEELTLRAPFAGVVTTPQLEQKVGQDLVEGDLLTTLADRSRMRARILVRDWELEDVKVGAPVKLNVRAYPLHSYTGTVQGILPAAALDRPISDPKKLERKGQELTNYFAVVLDVDNPDGSLQEGMTGTAKIYGGGAPLAWRAVRAVGRWLASVQFFW